MLGLFDAQVIVNSSRWMAASSWLKVSLPEDRRAGSGRLEPFARPTHSGHVRSPERFVVTGPSPPAYQVSCRTSTRVGGSEGGRTPPAEMAACAAVRGFARVSKIANPVPRSNPLAIAPDRVQAHSHGRSSRVPVRVSIFANCPENRTWQRSNRVAYLRRTSSDSLRVADREQGVGARSQRTARCRCSSATLRSAPPSRSAFDPGDDV